MRSPRAILDTLFIYTFLDFFFFTIRLHIMIQYLFIIKNTIV